MVAIEKLLVRAAQDPAAIPVLLSALLDADVLVPGFIEGAADGVAAEGSRARFAHLATASGEPVQPFYTSEPRFHDTLRQIPGFESHFVGMPCRDLFDVTRGATLVLNPHSDWGKEFTPSEVSQLLDGAAQLKENIIQQETTVFVGAPASIPDGMEDALRSLFVGHSVVERAFLGWKVDASTDDQSYLLVIVGSESTRNDLSAELGRALVYFSQVHPVDVMFARPVENHLLGDLSPFYERATAKRRLFRR